jgi:hypothetical protein
MLWYSCSAPRVDLAELQEEISNLSEEERRSIQGDLTGTTLEAENHLVVKQKIVEFQRILDRQNPMAKESFCRSMTAVLGDNLQNVKEKYHAYVHSDAFSLIILRSRRYNSQVRKLEKIMKKSRKILV